MSKMASASRTRRARRAQCYIWVALATALSPILLPAAASAAGSFNIQVLSATVKDRTVPGAQVILQREGMTSQSAVTDAHGRVSINNNLGGVDDPSITVIVKKPGFSPLIAKCPCDGMAYAISETLTQLDALRVVLSWGAQPQDLDLHAVYGRSHVFWNSKVGNRANLDVDDTTGYGPETITIERRLGGQKYVFAVHNYSDREQPTSAALARVSRAKVFVYVGDSLIRTYYVPAAGAATAWIVFGIDEQGGYHDINQMTVARTPANVRDLLREVASKPGFAPAAVASVEAKQRSNDLNKRGERAYHAGDLEGAIALYREAIEADGGNGQAHSNLGLAYQKSGRIAEAIWASRKAIELASGEAAATVRAGSFYNIARMYEAKSQWQDAKESFEAALRNRERPAYREGIARMQAKIEGR